HATRRGIELVRDTYARLSRRWDAGTGEEHRQRGVTRLGMLHELLITEFDLAVRLTVDRLPDLGLVLTERRYFRGDRELRFGDDERRLAEILAQTLELPSAMRDRLWLASVERLRQHQADDRPLGGALWLRARDARVWLPAYREYSSRLPRGRGEERSRGRQTG